MTLDGLGAHGGIAIRAKGLAFTYPEGTEALRGVDLQIAPGELVAIVGQNGSGKSTLVRHFNGLLRATRGTVLVGEERIGQQHVAALAQRVGIAFQNPDSQLFSGRVAAEVAFGARNAGLSGGAAEGRVDAALALLGLDDVRGANPYDLGFSRRKLLATASVIAMGTPAIVLDEPTTGQDARGIERIQQAIAALVGLGRTVIAISHDMRFVAETFDRLIVMRDGRIVLDGPVAEAFDEPNWATLESTYLEAPLAARIGARLGRGPTPTEASLIEALRSEPAQA
jgi:energy-coupling factor transport system ATP-binding protein